ncbi:MAG TPA: hypothetical protein VL240_02770 [Candidatus Binatia bacterium]|nr:hypothetical protein [Candidatus Binatia bacterium]
MKTLLALAAVVVLATVALAQDSGGTVNTLSLNPRQNQELTGSTGTETGQPSDAVPGSENMPNGLVPVTTNMMGSGSNGNMDQTAPRATPPAPASSAAPQKQSDSSAATLARGDERKNAAQQKNRSR